MFISFWIANSVNPDQSGVLSDLHCLPKSQRWEAWRIWIKQKSKCKSNISDKELSNKNNAETSHSVPHVYPKGHFNGTTQASFIIA